MDTCFLALLVNYCSFGLIGKTSPTTFQVVGHAKTCLVLIGGYVMFPTSMNDEQFMYNVVGVLVAMCGVFLYGHIKSRSGGEEQEDDCFDKCCPLPIMKVVDPSRYDETLSEQEALTQ